MQGDTIYVDVEIGNGSVNGINKSYKQLIQVRARTLINFYFINCLNDVTLI